MCVFWKKKIHEFYHLHVISVERSVSVHSKECTLNRAIKILLRNLTFKSPRSLSFNSHQTGILHMKLIHSTNMIQRETSWVNQFCEILFHQLSNNNMRGEEWWNDEMEEKPVNIKSFEEKSQSQRNWKAFWDEMRNYTIIYQFSLTIIVVVDDFDFCLSHTQHIQLSFMSMINQQHPRRQPRPTVKNVLFIQIFIVSSLSLSLFVPRNTFFYKWKHLIHYSFIKMSIHWMWNFAK